MLKRNRTFKALLSSVLSLILCLSMLIGTTFAWFTDSVSSGVNQILAGNLDVELFTEDGTDVQDYDALFSDVEYWEPGAVAYETLTVRNAGTLALQYQLSLRFTNENTLDGQGLSQILQVAVISGAVSGTRDEVVNAASDWCNLSDWDHSSDLEAGAAATYTVVIRWEPSSNDNDFNVNNGQSTSDGQPLHIDLGVHLVATQLSKEKDSFGEDYDKLAVTSKTVVSSAAELVEAVEAGKNVILANDIALSTRITVTSDITIDLSGYTLNCGDKVAIDTSADAPAVITIDGRTAGSTIEVRETGGNARAIQAKSDSTVNVLGGTYIGISNGGNGSVIYAASGATLNVSDATVIATETSGTSRGFSISDGATANITNCEITAITVSKKSYGVYNSGKTIISGCTINAYSNYDSSTGNLSQGVLNYYDAELTLIDCYVSGTHSGVQNAGKLIVNGGTYEGYSHGGIYFSGEYTVSYVSNATIRESTMPEGYTSNGVANYAAFYIGGDSNITVYMDGCEISGSVQTIVMRGSSNEQNNAIYISNSEINLGGVTVRVGNENNMTNRLYLGVGNNFTAENTNNPTCVIVTNETYTQN